MTSPEVRLARDGPVATVTLGRPDPRISRPQWWEAVRECGRRLPGDVRMVVVEGERGGFAVGPAWAVADGVPARLADLPPAEAEERLAEWQQAFAWLRRPDLVTVAAVQGPARGLGCQLALACDLRILAHDAELSLADPPAAAPAEPPAHRSPDQTDVDGSDPLGWYAGTKQLVALVGYARALELCLTGRRVTAAEAQRIGLANLVVPAAELPAAVADLTAAVLTVDRATAAEIKAMLAEAANRSYAEQERAERQAQLRQWRLRAGVGD